MTKESKQNTLLEDKLLQQMHCGSFSIPFPLLIKSGRASVMLQKEWNNQVGCSTCIPQVRFQEIIGGCLGIYDVQDLLIPPASICIGFILN